MSREEFFEPFPAEGKRTKFLFDNSKKLIGLRVSNWFPIVIKFEHVVTAVVVFPDLALTSGAEGFDCVLLSFFHPVLVWTLDNWDTLAGVDVIATDTMAT